MIVVKNKDGVHVNVRSFDENNWIRIAWDKRDVFGLNLGGLKRWVDVPSEKYLKTECEITFNDNT